METALRLADQVASERASDNESVSEQRRAHELQLA